LRAVLLLNGNRSRSNEDHHAKRLH